LSVELAAVFEAMDEIGEEIERVEPRWSSPRTWRARSRAIYVVEDHAVARALEASVGTPGSAADRMDRAGRSVLGYVEDLGRSKGVPVGTVLRGGDPLEEILDEARRWKPQLMVIGRTGRRGPASPLLGSLAAHVLEFADCPVIVTSAGERGNTARD
jgi:nucleotide-binding universal stress UspA family protein